MFFLKVLTHPQDSTLAYQSAHTWIFTILCHVSHLC